MPQVLINDIITNYKVTGDGQIDIVFLHGWGCDLNIFENLISKIDTNKFKIISIDFPGFGKTKKPNEVWGVGEYADFLKSFINKLEIKNPIILGHSFGGRVAIKFAKKYPELIQKIILTGSAGIKNELSKKRIFITKIGKVIFSLPVLKKYKPTILKKIGAVDLYKSGEMEQIFKKVINEDLQEDAKEIRQPTLLIYGINDQDTPIEYGQIFYKLIPRSKLEIIKNAGHYVFLDQEEKFLNILNNFIGN